MAEAVTPTSLHLHQRSRVLDLHFSDGRRFSLPCEYLRVYSPSAECRGHGSDSPPPEHKAGVNISRIEEVGHYAVRLHFDDGHNTGLYSWQYLYQLGVNQETNWKQYLSDLRAAKRSREAADL